MNIRIRDELVSRLRQEAERQGLSLQGLVNDILQREFVLGAPSASRPLIKPPGWSEQFEDLERSMGDSSIRWIVLYEVRGQFLIHFGHVVEVSPTDLVVRPEGWRNCAIPRWFLRSWQPVPPQRHPRIALDLAEEAYRTVEASITPDLRNFYRR